MRIETIISERCYNQDQSWYYERTSKFESPAQSEWEWLWHRVKLKVNIRRNAYDHQSYARVHLWNGQQWNLLVDAPISECLCKDVDWIDKNAKPSFFTADCNRLIVEALKIC